jgi:ankyrin repeat protein
VPTIALPDQPNLEQLRNQARELQRAVRAADPQDPAAFPLTAAQSALAQRYGFASWPRLKRHIEIIQRYSRFPEAEVDGEAPADAFLRLACLGYVDDQPEKWRRSADLLAARPDLAQGNVHVAAAVADAAELGRILRADPAAASREGGPHRWEPLMYLAYSRHERQGQEADVFASARLLLDAGADPGAGYLWHGLPTPFTVLTGAFGQGEAGPVRTPSHPQSLALARVLLEAGADPNDAQALYNRMFEAGDDHLELLFEFGLGSGDGGVWAARMAGRLDRPAQLVRAQLAWAITHGLDARVRLIVAHGIDLSVPVRGRASAAGLAVTTGHPELVDFLVEHGSRRPSLTPVQEYVGAMLAADRPAIERLRATHAGIDDAARSARPALVVWAAVAGQPGSLELLVAAGFDVDALGRSDHPGRQEWETALHYAANAGNLGLAHRLLALGARTDIHDQRFDATPLGWARHAGQQELIDLLEPVTAG